ncbi:copper oxidase [Corynebacterium sp. SA-MJD20WY100]|uniref:copper oxidase n=1 Tax=Corynebacterium sp. SA-MJD20WY100 TaxID=3142969 RepID=UPI003221DB0D
MNNQKTVEEKFSPRVWHRRAARPVSVWMMIFILIGLTHFAIPNYGWLLVHVFTLGILTNSILVWSQHLTEKFVQHKLADSARPRQLYRIYGLNIGALIVMVGQVFKIPYATITGAAIIAVLMAWHGVEIIGQWKGASGKRFRPIVGAYAASAFCLPVGAFFGGWLALDPGNPRLLIAHIAANIGGFVGLAAAASLTILLPTVWRSQGISTYMTPTLWILGAGVLVTIVGALVGFPECGFVVYVIGWVLAWQQWLGNVNLKQFTYASASSIAAVTWLVLTLAYFAVELTLQVQPKIPTIPLLVGFAAQLLIGMMSYLLPSTMGGGPGATRAGLIQMYKFGLLRWTFINGGLLLWISGTNSYQNVVMSLLCLGSLAVFPIFMIRAVKAQKAVLKKEKEAPAAEPEPRFMEIGIGVAILALVWVLFQL